MIRTQRTPLATPTVLSVLYSLRVTASEWFIDSRSELMQLVQSRRACAIVLFGSAVFHGVE